MTVFPKHVTMSAHVPVAVTYAQRHQRDNYLLLSSALHYCLQILCVTLEI